MLLTGPPQSAAGLARPPTEINGQGPRPSGGGWTDQTIGAGSQLESKAGERARARALDDHVRRAVGRRRGGRGPERVDADAAPSQLPDDVVAAVLVGEHVLGDEDEGGARAEPAGAR